jgi:hypothetical protein
MADKPAFDPTQPFTTGEADKPAFDPTQPFEAGGQQSIAPPPVKDWSEVPGRALRSLPSSAGNFLTNMAQPFIHPVATAMALKDIGHGALQATGMLSGDEHVGDLHAVGHFLMDRYGSMDALKNTLANDPVGVAGDLSMLLSGGETAAARVPGIVGEVARGAGTVGRAVNPVNAALTGARAVGRAGELVGSEGLGLLTGAGPAAVRTAAGAGYEGGQAGQEFLQNIRGNVSAEDVVSDAKDALIHMRAQRGTEYRQGMANVGQDKKVLDFNDIDAAMQRANAVKNFEGESLSPSTSGIRKKIQDTIDDWRRLPPGIFRTAEGFDALKQKIGDLRDATDFLSPERKVANEAYGAVRQTIIKQVPKYAQVMKGYEEASTLTKEIERTLSLPKDSKTGPTVDTALRKLQSVLRNNVNTNYGRREELARYLVNSGAPHLMEALAGQAMNSWMPRGLAQVAARLGVEGGAAALGFGAAGVPAAAGAVATLPFMSPRLMGESAYKAGTLARPFKHVPEALRPAVVYGGTGASRLGGNWLTDAHGRVYAGPQGPGIANAGEDQPNVPGIPSQQKGGRVTQEGYARGGGVHGQQSTKAEAEYKTRGQGKRICANCTMFRAPSSCTSVKGQISPQAVCKFFEAKKGRAAGGRVSGIHIDTSHTVRTGANSSADGKTVFIDSRIPEKFHKFLAVHETVEQRHMAGGYLRAHKIATVAERKAVDAAGVPWKHYTDEIDGFLDHAEHEKDTNPPPGKLHVNPDVALGHHYSRNK